MQPVVYHLVLTLLFIWTSMYSYLVSVGAVYPREGFTIGDLIRNGIMAPNIIVPGLLMALSNIF